MRTIAADARRSRSAELIREAVPGHDVRRRDPRRDRRSRPSSWSGTRCRTAAGGRRSTSCSTAPALKLLARHEELDAAGVLGRCAEPRSADRAGDHLVVDVGAAGDQRGRRHQGVDAGPALRPARASTPRTWSRSATCPTTCRCSSWAGTSYAMADAHPTRRRGGRPRRARPRRRRRGARCWLVSSACDLLRCAPCSAASLDRPRCSRAPRRGAVGSVPAHAGLLAAAPAGPSEQSRRSAADAVFSGAVEPVHRPSGRRRQPA